MSSKRYNEDDYIDKRNDEGVDDTAKKLNTFISGVISTTLSDIKKDMNEKLESYNFIIDQHTKDIGEIKKAQYILDAQISMAIKLISIVGGIITLINILITVLSR